MNSLIQDLMLATAKYGSRTTTRNPELSQAFWDNEIPEARSLSGFSMDCTVNGQSTGMSVSVNTGIGAYRVYWDVTLDEAINQLAQDQELELELPNGLPSQS